MIRHHPVRARKTAHRCERQGETEKMGWLLQYTNYLEIPRHSLSRLAHTRVHTSIYMAHVYKLLNGRRFGVKINSFAEKKVRVSLRVEGDRAPERLQIAADQAARSGDLRTTIEYASGARHVIQLWDEFRVWDPGD